jgi:hypothetical protein
MKTKVAIIGTVGLPAKYGGFETLTAHLVEELSDTYDFTVYCSSKKYSKKRESKAGKGKTEVSSFRRQRNPEYSLRYMVYFSCFIPK